MMKKWIIAGIVVITIGATVTAFFLSRKTKTREESTKIVTQEKKKAPSLDIALRFIQGIDGQGPLLKIRLFSRRLLQQDIDNRTLYKGAEKAIEPLVVPCPESFWEEAVAFFVSGDSSENPDIRRLDAGIRLVRAPEEAEWTFTSGKTYEALYQLPLSASPSPGSRLFAEISLEGQVISSNDVTVPPIPSDEKKKLIQKIRVLLNLGMDTEILETAEELISSFPDDPSGYWYKGMALESTGDAESALTAYEQALKTFPPPDREDNVEPPMRLVQKIRDLKRAIKR